MVDSFVNSEKMGQLRRRLLHRYKVPHDDVDLVAFSVLTRAMKRLEEGTSPDFDKAVFGSERSVVDHYFNDRKEHPVTRYHDNIQPDNSNTVEKLASHRQLLYSIREYLDDMDNQQHAKVFRAVVVDAIPEDDVAEMLGVSIDNIRKIISRVRCELRSNFYEEFILT